VGSQIIRVNDTVNAAITGSNMVDVKKAGLLPLDLNGGSPIDWMLVNALDQYLAMEACQGIFVGHR
jgi:hypothetical protein